MLRDLKRALKKRGNKHRRAELKRNLANNPEEAAHAEEDLGRYRSDTLNKLDNDSTRKKKDEKNETTEEKDQEPPNEVAGASE
jgi:hypothetical protein